MLLKWPILDVSVMGGNLEFLDFLKKSFITSTTSVNEPLVIFYQTLAMICRTKFILPLFPSFSFSL